MHLDTSNKVSLIEERTKKFTSLAVIDFEKRAVFVENLAENLYIVWISKISCLHCFLNYECHEVMLFFLLRVAHVWLNVTFLIFFYNFTIYHDVLNSNCIRSKVVNLQHFLDIFHIIFKMSLL